MLIESCGQLTWLTKFQIWKAVCSIFGFWRARADLLTDLGSCCLLHFSIWWSVLGLCLFGELSLSGSLHRMALRAIFLIKFIRAFSQWQLRWIAVPLLLGYIQLTFLLLTRKAGANPLSQAWAWSLNGDKKNNGSEQYKISYFMRSVQFWKSHLHII